MFPLIFYKHHKYNAVQGEKILSRQKTLTELQEKVHDYASATRMKFAVEKKLELLQTR
jgi:hypothetical protein